MFASNCERLATLLTASSKNATAISSLHTETETVLVNSLAVVRLECSFHLSFIFILVIIILTNSGAKRHKLEALTQKASAKLGILNKMTKDLDNFQQLFLSFL